MFLYFCLIFLFFYFFYFFFFFSKRFKVSVSSKDAMIMMSAPIGHAPMSPSEISSESGESERQSPQLPPYSSQWLVPLASEILESHKQSVRLLEQQLALLRNREATQWKQIEQLQQRLYSTGH